MLRIFFYRIWIRSGLKEFLCVCIRFRVFNICNRFVSKCSKITFLWCRYPLQSYLTKTNTIRIQLRIRTQIWKKYDISDIHPYPIRFHPYLRRRQCSNNWSGRSNLQTAMGWMQTLLGFLKFTLKHVISNI